MRPDNEMLPHINEPHLPRFPVAISLFSLGLFCGLTLAMWCGI